MRPRKLERRTDSRALLPRSIVGNMRSNLSGSMGRYPMAPSLPHLSAGKISQGSIKSNMSAWDVLSRLRRIK